MWTCGLTVTSICLSGPNGSGKSTLFDAIGFMFDLLVRGPESAVAARTSNFQDLVWGRPNEELGFELAAEFDIDEQPFPLRGPC